LTDRCGSVSQILKICSIQPQIPSEGNECEASKGEETYSYPQEMPASIHLSSNPITGWSRCIQLENRHPSSTELCKFVLTPKVRPVSGRASHRVRLVASDLQRRWEYLATRPRSGRLKGQGMEYDTMSWSSKGMIL